MNTLTHCALSIGYKETNVEQMVSTKFIGSQIDNRLNWKNVF